MFPVFVACVCVSVWVDVCIHACLSENLVTNKDLLKCVIIIPTNTIDCNVYNTHTYTHTENTKNNQDMFSWFTLKTKWEMSPC